MLTFTARVWGQGEGAEKIITSRRGSEGELYVARKYHCDAEKSNKYLGDSEVLISSHPGEPREIACLDEHADEIVNNLQTEEMG